jgi:hypothetical protein
MNGLFGVELPTAVNFVIAFVVVLLLIGAAAWLVRRLGAPHVDTAARGRQPRLAVVDSAAVDGRRKLVIVRRDNVEHLLMIGGPTDVLVEANIVRVAGAAREAPPPRPGAEPQRLLPFTEPNAWPLQPEPAATPIPTPAPTPVAAPAMRADRGPRVAPEDAPQWQPSPAETAQAAAMRGGRPADTFMDLATELSRPEQVLPAHGPAHGPAHVPSHGPAHMAAPVEPTMDEPIAPAVNGPPPAIPADQSLAEMAQRLEAALRRPVVPKIVTESARAPAPRPERPAGKGAPLPKPQSAPNLEQEMASLLGRPGKT